MTKLYQGRPLQAGESLSDNFFEIPALVYATDPHWPGEDAKAIRQQFSASNPWFVQGKAWVGCYPGQARLAGFIAPSLSGEPQACFGFWETLDNLLPNRLLFNALSQWAKAEGATRLIGPINFTTLGKYRLRTDPLSCKPFPGEPYNPIWYQHLLQQMGFVPCVNYKSIFDDRPTIIDFTRQTLVRCHRLPLEGITLDPLTPTLWKAHQQPLYQAITKEFCGNPGWCPPSEALFAYHFNENTIEPYCHADGSCIAFGPQGDIAGLLFCLDWPEQQTSLLKTLMITRAWRRSRLYCELNDRFSRHSKKHFSRLGGALLNIHGPTHSTLIRACSSANSTIHHYALYQKDFSHELL